MTAMVREVMNIREASAYLGVSTKSLYRLLREKRIPAFKLGNRWRFKNSVLDGWMEKESTHRESGEEKNGASSSRKNRPA